MNGSTHNSAHLGTRHASGNAADNPSHDTSHGLYLNTVASVALRYTQTYLVFGALFVLVVAYRDTIWTAPLRWRFMQLTGALSYCLYLIHLSIGDGYEYLVRAYGIVPAERFGASGAVLARTAVMVVASFVLAWLSRRYLEEPFLNLKDRFTRRRPTAVAVEPSPELTGA